MAWTASLPAVLPAFGAEHVQESASTLSEPSQAAGPTTYVVLSGEHGHGEYS